jgi:hypothetical protein
MSHLTIKNEEGCPRVDGLLREFFQAEMPHPWPAFKMPVASQRSRSAPLLSRHAGRLALAACIALFVAGYLTLSGFFPGKQADTGVQSGPKIGMREKASPKR